MTHMSINGEPFFANWAVVDKSNGVIYALFGTEYEAKEYAKTWKYSPKEVVQVIHEE